MSLWRQLTRGWRNLKNRTLTDREADDEVSHYLEESEADLIAKGLPPDKARRMARLQMGSTGAVREQMRESGWENKIETLLADVRYAFRTLASNRGFAAVSILTLALGIGASTSIFSVVDAVLLRSLPYPNPAQIVRIWEQAPDGHRMSLAHSNFEDFRSQNNTLAYLAEYGDMLTSVSGGLEPVRVKIAWSSGNFLKVLGVQPLVGSDFSAGDDRQRGTPGAIVSYSYWQQYLGGTSDLTKFHLRLITGVYPVVGVMPRGFDFPSDVAVWISNDSIPDSGSRTAHNWQAIGRVRDGVTVAQARANLSAIARRIRKQYGKDVDLSDAAVVPLSDALVGDIKTALLTLISAVGLLLLVACTNVAGLLLARTSARRKELAVRAALGAGRGRLLQQFLTESFSLSLAGGILGLALAACAIKMLPAIIPANLPRQEGIAINTSVLLFALAASIVVALLLGFFGAWRAGARDLQQSLTAGSRSYTGSGASQRFRSVLVVGEIGVTLLILVGAGLLGRSFLRLISTSPGFRSDHLITMEFSPVQQGEPFAMDQAAVVRQTRLMEEILTRLRRVAAGGNVGLVGALPVAAGDNLAEGSFLILNGRKPPTNFAEWDHISQNPSQVGQALYCVASEQYFRTLGIPLVRGRLFGEADTPGAPHVAVISESLARERWPNVNPIGQVIDFGNMDGNLKPLTIVGIVGDVRAGGLNLPPSSVIYTDFRQRGLNSNSTPTVLVRSSAPPAQIIGAARSIFHELAPDTPVKFSTFADEMGGWLADRRFLLLLVAFFAASALALAAVGIYGVVAFSVALRTQEIGTRMALGAQRTDVLRLIINEGARMALLGVLVGVLLSLAITRLLSSLLFGISAIDPLTFAAVAALLVAVALLASYIPARRAMRLEPTSALRYE